MFAASHIAQPGGADQAELEAGAIKTYPECP
jgi:hypothetical protein